ncbi:tRNA lysidine(34) synthetase TilS [Aliidiomarina haloalkalitolerans]|uniref:tRNA(Ile)-lysidine synthase n=1 Tax=Aliidiomarina haloalkalitolerans TaxID=859059 RepID=A0A432VXL4_9GAMM|nr:tRNA lysidine(34) synthetase TilS [Aliidiomarina haloalkalitolerans]RUO21441.1 tRNA lysidine(34) synthetase TilS [Aliidiomarina haloalkalitolerans]
MAQTASPTGVTPADLYPLYVQLLTSLDLPAGQQIVVALGGGADSQTVFDLTLRFRQDFPDYQYLAIHLDHYFHPDSPQWAEFLRNYCQQAEIDHIVEAIDVPTGKRLSKEEQGRNARYQRLAELTDENAIILLGQHRTDQVETLFLQLKRGAGPKGLAGMQAVAPFRGQRRLVRPLLTVTKAQIYDYAHAHGVGWIEDDTNQDTRIERNFFRHVIIPQIEARFPAFQATAARSAAFCGEQTELLDQLLADKLASYQTADGWLELRDWWSWDEKMQRAMLRAWLDGHAVTLPSAAILHELQTQIQRSHSGKQVRVRWSGVEVYRQQRWLKINQLFKSA